MGISTPTLDLYLPGGGSLEIGGSDEVADIDQLNQNFQKIDAYAITVDAAIAVQVGRNQQYFGTEAARTSVVGMKRGDSYQESNNNFRRWEYDGTNWALALDNGLYQIIPSAVSGTGVSLDAPTGRVLFAAATNGSQVCVDGVFTAAYRKYIIDVDVDAVAALVSSLFFGYRNGGTNQAGTAYFTSRLYALGGTATAVATASGGSHELWGGSAAIQSGGAGSVSIEVFRPADAARRTLMRSKGMSVIAASGVVTADAAGHHNVAQANDGFRILPANGATISGELKIYGVK